VNLILVRRLELIKDTTIIYEFCSLELSCEHAGVKSIEISSGFRTDCGLGYYVVPGYNYDDRQQDDRSILTHLQSGLQFGFWLFSEKHMHQFIERIAPLTDWTRSQAELQAEVGLPDQVREILQRITDDFELIPDPRKADAGLNALEELLSIAQFATGVDDDEIEENVSFEVDEDRCSIILKGYQVSLWNMNYALCDSLDPDWQVEDIQQIQEVK
jgi:hypothetical protein